jgi:hypothetical protein
MACPVVAGACVLMRQYFMDGFYPSGAASVTDAFTPSGALVKACVVNSAVDISGQAGFPGDREGWGRIRIDGAGYFAGDAERLIVLDVRNGAPGALSTGATRFLRFRADSGGGGPALKVTLAYHDAPAALGATFAPVNNLDLVVRGASTDPYLGNVFSGGVSSTGGTADVRNNLEQVLIPSPPTGTWTVRVNATAVNVGTQGYALVVTGDVVELCLADFNGDESLDFFDYDDFVAAFEAAAPSADFNVDGMVDFFDYDDFVAAFEMGC